MSPLAACSDRLTAAALSCWGLPFVQFGVKAGALIEGLLSGPSADMRADKAIGMTLREVRGNPLCELTRGGSMQDVETSSTAVHWFSF